ncbi:sigma-70 family RNA polymerase sigma factor [Paenibacillus elgii]|uniref:sigma-70 family RNA polymerase sigma factor n=1 Tax=Paenibacillus elgii TaxID=189691 RepID=UPI0030D9691D
MYNRKDFMDELFHEGSIGLYEAYRSYDPTKMEGKAVKFWSYAQHRVRGRMIDFIGRQSNLIRPSRNVEIIAVKIKKIGLQEKEPNEIADILNCSINMAKQAVEFLRIRNVASFSQPINPKNYKQGLELGNIIPYSTDFSETEIPEIWKHLTSQESVYLDYKMQELSTKEIREKMGLERAELLDINNSLIQKARQLYANKEKYLGTEFMTKKEVKLPMLTKAEYLKHKNNNILEKEICRKYKISKSALIKLKKSWGLAKPRKQKKEKIIAISNMLKISESDSTPINEKKSEELKITQLHEKITSLETKLRELEGKLAASEHEREILWKMQDILRAKLV